MEFEINKRFGFLGDLAKMVIMGVSPSLLVLGEGGLGKSYSIKNALVDCGIEEYEYVFFKGYSTARGLYNSLYDNNGKVIVFDDCDSVLEDKVAIDILKSALDSYDEREITWMSKMNKSDEYPNKFKFNGRIIFISNKKKSSLDQAVLSRSLVVDLSMSPEDKIERMSAIIDNVLPEYCREIKIEALNFLDSVKDKVSINMRMFIMVTKMAVNFPDRWEAMATYMVTNVE
jgi:hypothetical protein